MSELKTISIDGKEYNIDELSDQQKAVLAQINDIQQKLANLQFQADQLTVAKDAFIGILKQSLEAPPASE